MCVAGGVYGNVTGWTIAAGSATESAPSINCGCLPEGVGNS